MIHSVDPRQNRLFDPFDGVIPPAGRKIVGNGWQGVFRHAILEVMPVAELAKHFSDSTGAPTKELYSIAGLVFLADFFDWNAQQAIEAYIFRNDVQYALNTEPGVTLSTRTLERYQRLFRDNDLAATVFDKVTTQLVAALDLDVSGQRLDSTHVFSHMATFGRTKLMAVAIKRVFTPLQRHHRDAPTPLPHAFRPPPAPAQSSGGWRSGVSCPNPSGTPAPLTPPCPTISASATRRHQRDSSPTPRTPTPAHATVSKPPKTFTSSSPASPIDPTTRADRPIGR